MTRDLINEVKKVNRQAALFMQRQIPLELRRGKIRKIILSDNLTFCFVFSETVQGFKYWNDIAEQLPKGFGWNQFSLNE